MNEVKLIITINAEEMPYQRKEKMVAEAVNAMRRTLEEYMAWIEDVEEK